MFFEGDRAKWKSAQQDGKAKSVWFVLPCQRTSPMVPLHMAGFPGKHGGTLSNFTAPILTKAKDTVFIPVNILPIFPAFPNHAWINIGDSLHSTNSNVLSRQQTCHQRNPKHYILRIWNCYIVTDHIWCQVSFACKKVLISNEIVALHQRESHTLKFRVNADINYHRQKISSWSLDLLPFVRENVSNRWLLPVA